MKMIKIIIIGIVLLLIIVSTLYWFNRKPTFDESLTGVHIYDKDKIQPGVFLHNGKMLNKTTGEVIKNYGQGFQITIHDKKVYKQETVNGNYSISTLSGEKLFESDINIHHELHFTEDGNLLTLSRNAHMFKGRNVDFDTIVEINESGFGVIDEVYNTWDSYSKIKSKHPDLELDGDLIGKASDEANYQNKSPTGANYDYYHANSVKELGKNELENIEYNINGKIVKPFQAKNLLLSFRHGSMVLIIDRDTKEIVWYINQFAIEKMEGQHSPTMQSNGLIMIFDNSRSEKKTRIIEIDPITLEVVWEYTDKNFFTQSQGQVQVLDNGNLFITESEKGRVFELDKKTKEIVWEFYSDERQTEESQPDHKENWGRRNWIYRSTHYNLEEINEKN